MSFLDFLFPRRCVKCRTIGTYLCAQCFSYIHFNEYMICLMCQRPAIGGITHPICKTKYSIDGVFPSLIYKGVVKKLVYTFKYSPYLTALQPQLVDLLYEGLIQKEFFYKQLSPKSVLVPIPLHGKKFRKRGYNQSFLLADGLAKKFELEVIQILQRVKETKTQVGFSKDEREKNIKGAFAVDPKVKDRIGEYEEIFLVDDVVTSGATLKEAANILKRAGVKKVWGVTLAHGE